MSQDDDLRRIDYRKNGTNLTKTKVLPREDALEIVRLLLEEGNYTATLSNVNRQEFEKIDSMFKWRVVVRGEYCKSCRRHQDYKVEIEDTEEVVNKYITQLKSQGKEIVEILRFRECFHPY